MQGFEQHVKKEHNQWAYLFFFIHLDETRPNDYTALELYVHRMVSDAPRKLRNSVSFSLLPLLVRALCRDKRRVLRFVVVRL